ncbi:hypothetical protein BXO590_10940, partial [Xanthomonas oryzae pv. oryzae]
MKCSTLSIFGLGVPLRTTMPILESASSTRDAGATRPVSISFCSALPTMITTSACSPRASRLGMACGVSPIEGPSNVVTFTPVCLVYCGAKRSTAAVNPPEVITVNSCALAAIGSSAAATIAASTFFHRGRIIFALLQQHPGRSLSLGCLGG